MVLVLPVPSVLPRCSNRNAKRGQQGAERDSKWSWSTTAVGRRSTDAQNQPHKLVQSRNWKSRDSVFKWSFDSDVIPMVPRGSWFLSWPVSGGQRCRQHKEAVHVFQQLRPPPPHPSGSLHCHGAITFTLIRPHAYSQFGQSLFANKGFQTKGHVVENRQSIVHTGQPLSGYQTPKYCHLWLGKMSLFWHLDLWW